MNFIEKGDFYFEIERGGNSTFIFSNYYYNLRIDDITRPFVCIWWAAGSTILRLLSQFGYTAGLLGLLMCQR